MSEDSPNFVLQIKANKSSLEMAKVQIKSERIVPFSGIFSIMEQFDTLLLNVIDSTQSLRTKTRVSQYSEIFRSLMCVFFCSGSCIEDVSTHLMSHLSCHPKLKICSSDTILRTIKELTASNTTYTSTSPVSGMKRKTYMWCLVNRKARIVIFFYEDTEDENGNARLKSLQSDRYNVYNYLDNELIDIEHLCCLAHARAKFKYVYEQGCKLAFFFLYMIGRLYRLEEEYKRLKLSPQEIYERRNDDATTEITESIRTRLYNGNKVNSNLMLRALNYLRTFWKQIFAYRNDGEYSIDNTIAERAIRPHCPAAKRKHVLRKR